MGSVATFVPAVDFKSKAAVEKYILIANAYRKGTPGWVHKMEADAFLRLMRNGSVTKAEVVAVARQKGRPTPPGPGVWPIELAARAAGLDPSTYRRFRYVTEPSGGARKIDEARKSGSISAKQAGALKRELTNDRVKLQAGEIAAKTADSTSRRRLTNSHRRPLLHRLAAPRQGSR